MLSHGWDTPMPMPGITVEGSDWKLYLFFVRDTQLVGVHLLTLSKHVHIKSNCFSDHDGPSEDGLYRHYRGDLSNRRQALHPHEVGHDKVQTLVSRAHLEVV